MKITIDIDTFNITLPKDFYEKLKKENEYNTKHYGAPVTPEEKIRIAIDVALNNPKKYLHIEE